MAQSLLLPWFPIVLAVGVGGRLLGRSRGFGLGGLCALFWIALVQAGVGLQVWQNTGNAIALIVGSFAIVMMGGWAGGSDAVERSVEGSSQADVPADESGAREGALAPFGAAVEQFQDWLDNHRDRESPWAEFGEFVRSFLYQCCQATHVKPYRLVPDRQELELLRLADPYREAERVPARKGVLGHVITTGRSYIASSGKSAPADLVGTLAQETEFPVPWCFAVSCGGRRLGAVSVGHLNTDPQRNRTCLRLAEQLVAMFWSHLLEVTRSRLAGDDDPTSHLLNREAFFRAAQRTLAECYGQNEPVAVAIIAVGGCRRLNDIGRWELADELVREVGSVLRRKVRLDDQIARFDGSRFVWLLRRVDSELARLIVEQVMARVNHVVARVASSAAEAGDGVSSATIGVYCGLTGAGLAKPDLRTLVARALVQSHRARVERIGLATDLDAGSGRRSAMRNDCCEVCL